MPCMGVCRTIQHLGPLHHVESLIKLEVLVINLPWFPNVFFLFSKPKTEHSNKTVFDLFSFSYFIYRPACPYLLLLDARHPQLWCHSWHASADVSCTFHWGLVFFHKLQTGGICSTKMNKRFIASPSHVISSSNFFPNIVSIFKPFKAP